MMSTRLKFEARRLVISLEKSLGKRYTCADYLMSRRTASQPPLSHSRCWVESKAQTREGEREEREMRKEVGESVTGEMNRG
jgi:hypothetical protein